MTSFSLGKRAGVFFISSVVVNVMKCTASVRDFSTLCMRKLYTVSATANSFELSSLLP